MRCTRSRFSVMLLAVAVGCGGLAAGGDDARAQVPGQLVLVEKELPENLTGPSRTRYLAIKRLRVLKKKDGQEGYEARAYGRLKVVPRKQTLALPANAGKLQVLLVKRLGKRFKRIKLTDLEYTAGDKYVDFEVKLDASHDLKPRIKYRLRVVIQSAQKVDVVLAATLFQVDDGSGPAAPGPRPRVRRRPGGPRPTGKHTVQ
jgi:hypothetical protein